MSREEEVLTFLRNLDLQKIDNLSFSSVLTAKTGGSALSCLYESEGEDELQSFKVVIKFLIAPRNAVEVERFKLEFSFLNDNVLNSIPPIVNQPNPDPKLLLKRLIPDKSYPLPTIAYPYTEMFGGMISFFGYCYEEGELLSNINTQDLSLLEKLKLVHRICSALSYFNLSGYVHRDLHPENILLLNGHKMDPEEDRHDPRVVFLDLGNCQRKSNPGDEVLYFDRDLDEELVIEDNNKRLLSSFTSMPPDFIELGEKVEHYDAWAIGIFAYRLIFSELPFDLNTLNDVTALKNGVYSNENYDENLDSLPIGIRYILKHLLSVSGRNRPRTDSIVRLFRWLIYDSERFNDETFIKQVIHNDGFDPYHDPIDDIY